MGGFATYALKKNVLVTARAKMNSAKGPKHIYTQEHKLIITLEGIEKIKPEKVTSKVSEE